MKTMLVTGASSGIGRSTALAAANIGWKVIACGRNESRLASLRDESQGIETLAFDLTDLDACRTHLGGLQPDVTILNAGVCEYVDTDDWDPALFRRVFDANFFSAVNTLDALLPSLESGSQLIFVDSLARLLPFTRSEAYGASKAAVYYLAKSLEVDLRDRGLVVQSVSPGFVRTPLTDKNDFAMPMRIEADEAAAAILRRVESGERTAYFPTLFSGLLRLLSNLPSSLQTSICWQLARRQEAQS